MRIIKRKKPEFLPSSEQYKQEKTITKAVKTIKYGQLT